jgi:diacylglycerol kinase family enzyme
MSAFPKGRPVHAFLNIHSGFDDGTVCADQLTRQMESLGVPIEIHQVGKGMDIQAAVRRAVEEGAGAVIAGGGDGTLNAVASALRDTSVPMALLPIGTLNHLARDLGVPLDPDAAIEALSHSRTCRIDLGEVNGHIFLNNSIIGLYPAYRTARERYQERGRSKWLAILSAVISVFRFNPSFRVRLLVNGRELVRRTPYILVANNEHRMEGYQIGTRARIDQGLLWVYVMHRLSRWGLVRLACLLLFGRFHKSDDFETFAASSVEVITRRKRLSVALDGDVAPLSTPLHYRSLPGALTVMCPLESSMHADSAAVENAAV